MGATRLARPPGVWKRGLVALGAPVVFSPGFRPLAAGFCRHNSATSGPISRVVAGLMQRVTEQLARGSFVPPLTQLNALEPADVQLTLAQFSSVLQNELANSATHDTPLTDADFLNPRLARLPDIAQAVHDNTIPLAVRQLANFASPQQTMDSVVARLLHKHQEEQTLHTAKQQHSRVDLSSPAAWYPEARKMKRKFVLHVGPTNSGKTHHSLQALAKSRSGYYAGPLRLLAREIYERFNQQGIRCNLITGEEVIPCIDEVGKVSDISSGTIEMIPLHKKMDLCVIDEIQMIADDRRGAAWTSAVLGVQAKEVHMCGEESAVPLIQKLADITGDDLEIKTYKRLGKLTVMNRELGSFERLRKGDCLIAFSKRKILELKCEIERNTKFRVGVIYGALPPEIRSTEANDFNTGKYDVLVASDAIGMGLNLKIKRIVFYSTMKFNGTETAPLAPSATKQIAGRAGRYSADKGLLEGFVTAMRAKDLQHVRKMMDEPISSLTKACIWPTNQIWMLYMSKFPKDTSFYQILTRFEQETQNYRMANFFITELDVRYDILKLFLNKDLYKRTMIEDQLALSLAPFNIRMASPGMIETAYQFFETISKCETKNVFDFDFLHTGLLGLTADVSNTPEETVERLRVLEENHKVVLIFMWLSQRWPTLFVDKESAADIKTLIEKRISEELIMLRRAMKLARRAERDAA